MAKIDFSKLRGLRNTGFLQAVANVDEQFFIDSWALIKDEVYRLSELAWTADTNGNKTNADKYYKAINIYYYMLHLNLAINKEIVRRGLSDISIDMIEKYKLNCVTKNLQCLGVYYGAPYIKIWGELRPESSGEFASCDFELIDFTSGIYNQVCVEIPGAISETIPDTIPSVIPTIVLASPEALSDPDPIEVSEQTDIDRGYLYNGYVIDEIAPTGWRVMARSDWSVTAAAYAGVQAGSSSIAAFGKHMKHTSIGWETTDGTNEFNFSAIPTGFRFADGRFAGYYNGFYGYAVYWNSDDLGTSGLYPTTRAIIQIYDGQNGFNYSSGQGGEGVSIRICRDLTSAEELLEDGTFLDEFTDFDGNVYSVVKIVNIAVITSNLKVTHLANGTTIVEIQDNTAWSENTQPSGDTNDSLKLPAFSTYDNLSI